jgi:hypothetical protein
MSIAAVRRAWRTERVNHEKMASRRVGDRRGRELIGPGRNPYKPAFPPLSANMSCTLNGLRARNGSP